jgi:acetyl esterase/lipase
MIRIRVARTVGISLVLAAIGCSDGSTSITPVDATAIDADPDPDRTAALALLGRPCTDPFDAVYAAHTPPTPWTAADRGTIVACAYDRTVSVAEMTAHFMGLTLPVPTLSTAAYKFRVAYWTERNPGEALLTSGALYIPVTRRGAPSPLVVAGHGSVGVGDRCAPSREDPSGFAKDFRSMIYPLIGDGWVTLAPDYPGLGTPGAAAWQFAVDEGHSMLDATRAARHLTRAGLLSSHNAIVGHSNGGHAALAAQSYARAYGTDGTVDTVVVWAPLFISNAAWGALISDTGAALLTPAFIAMTLMYLDGHLAIYDDSATIDGAYLPGQRAAVSTLLETKCWGTVTDMVNGAASIGIATGRDAFQAGFVTEIGDCGLIGTCTTTLASTWKHRFAVDRPVPDATIPIVLWQGQLDTFLSPGYQQCGVDRLVAQGAALTTCLEPDSDHGSVTARSTTWVRAHLAHVLLGDAAPGACLSLASLSPSCSVPIANGLTPDEP